MCNKCHNESTRPEKIYGTGYKIFSDDGTSCAWGDCYEMDQNGWVLWQACYSPRSVGLNYGFCVMKSLDEARTALDMLGPNYCNANGPVNRSIWEVEYDDARWEHVEEAFVSIPIHMLLVGAFKKIKKVDDE